jgi:hypothetical protein
MEIETNFVPPGYAGQRWSVGSRRVASGGEHGSRKLLNALPFGSLHCARSEARRCASPGGRFAASFRSRFAPVVSDIGLARVRKPARKSPRHHPASFMKYPD